MSGAAVVLPPLVVLSDLNSNRSGGIFLSVVGLYAHIDKQVSFGLLRRDFGKRFIRFCLVRVDCHFLLFTVLSLFGAVRLGRRCFCLRCNNTPIDLYCQGGIRNFFEMLQRQHIAGNWYAK